MSRYLPQEDAPTLVLERIFSDLAKLVDEAELMRVISNRMPSNKVKRWRVKKHLTELLGIDFCENK